MWPTPRVAAADLSTGCCVSRYFEVELLAYIITGVLVSVSIEDFNISSFNHVYY